MAHMYELSCCCPHLGSYATECMYMCLLVTFLLGGTVRATVLVPAQGRGRGGGGILLICRIGASYAIEAERVPCTCTLQHQCLQVYIVVMHKCSICSKSGITCTKFAAPMLAGLHSGHAQVQHLKQVWNHTHKNCSRTHMYCMVLNLLQAPVCFSRNMHTMQSPGPSQGSISWRHPCQRCPLFIMNVHLYHQQSPHSSCECYHRYWQIDIPVLGQTYRRLSDVQTPVVLAQHGCLKSSQWEALTSTMTGGSGAILALVSI